MSETRAEKEEVSSFRWVINGVALTSGTVTARIERRESGDDDVEYLQSDETTWGETPHEFTLDLGADLSDPDLDDDAYYLFWKVPKSANGTNIQVVAFHSQRPEVLTDGPFFVTQGEGYEVSLS